MPDCSLGIVKSLPPMRAGLQRIAALFALFAPATRCTESYRLRLCSLPFLCEQAGLRVHELRCFDQLAR